MIKVIFSVDPMFNFFALLQPINMLPFGGGKSHSTLFNAQAV